MRELKQRNSSLASQLAKASNRFGESGWLKASRRCQRWPARPSRALKGACMSAAAAAAAHTLVRPQPPNPAASLPALVRLRPSRRGSHRPTAASCVRARRRRTRGNSASADFLWVLLLFWSSAPLQRSSCSAESAIMEQAGHSAFQLSRCYFISMEMSSHHWLPAILGVRHSRSKRPPKWLSSGASFRLLRLCNASPTNQSRSLFNCERLFPTSKSETKSRLLSLVLALSLSPARRINSPRSKRPI